MGLGVGDAFRGVAGRQDPLPNPAAAWALLQGLGRRAESQELCRSCSDPPLTEKGQMHVCCGESWGLVRPGHCLAGASQAVSGICAWER